MSRRERIEFWARRIILLLVEILVVLLILAVLAPEYFGFVLDWIRWLYGPHP